MRSVGHNRHDAAARSRLSSGLLLLGWLVLAGALLALLWTARARVIANLDRPEVRQEWQRWREEAQRQSKLGAGPVQRRPPKTDEPPALLLFRDHFGAVAFSSLLLASCLYLFLAIALRGAAGTSSFAPWRNDDSGAEKPLDAPKR